MIVLVLVYKKNSLKLFQGWNIFFDYILYIVYECYSAGYGNCCGEFGQKALPCCPGKRTALCSFSYFCTFSFGTKKTPLRLVSFETIYLLSIEGKIFSILAKGMSTYMVKSKYVDTSIQKGGIPGVSRCFEHADVLNQLIREAKESKGNLTVVWLDLANASGSIPKTSSKQLRSTISTSTSRKWSPATLEVVGSSYGLRPPILQLSGKTWEREL